MPIRINQTVGFVSDEEFHLIDYEIMGIIFSIHKEFGRFWNEKIYQNELLFRCQEMGKTNVAKEVAIYVSHQNFRKIYYIDLLIENIIYELKVAKSLTTEHDKQVLNYLMLSGLSKAKLINLGAPSVQYKFVTTTVTTDDRYNISMDFQQWINIDENCFWLK